MQTIALCNQKGGTAKTVTTINLGAALAKLCQQTLLIDLDPQSNTTVGIGIDRYQLSASMYDVMAGRKKLNDIVVQTYQANLFLAPTNLDLASSERELLGTPLQNVTLKRSMKELEQYDFVLVDCPPSLGLLTINALMACDDIIIPVDMSPFALEGMAQLLDTISLIHELEHQIRIRGVLVTKWDIRNKISQEVLKVITKHFGKSIFATKIRINTDINTACGEGMSVIDYAPKSRGAEDYMKLAKEVINHERPIGKTS